MYHHAVPRPPPHVRYATSYRGSTFCRRCCGSRHAAARKARPHSPEFGAVAFRRNKANGSRPSCFGEAKPPGRVVAFRRNKATVAFPRNKATETDTKTRVSPGRTKAPFLQNKPTEDDTKLNQGAMRRCSSFASAAVRSRKTTSGQKKNNFNGFPILARSPGRARR
jgi:hypothetical protein